MAYEYSFAVTTTGSYQAKRIRTNVELDFLLKLVLATKGTGAGVSKWQNDSWLKLHQGFSKKLQEFQKN